VRQRRAAGSLLQVVVLELVSALVAQMSGNSVI